MHSVTRELVAMLLHAPHWVCLTSTREIISAVRALQVTIIDMRAIMRATPSPHKRSYHHGVGYWVEGAVHVQVKGVSSSQKPSFNRPPRHLV